MAISPLSDRQLFALNEDRRRAATRDRDLNVARIADALERIADLIATLLEPETREDEREQDPGPDDAPASPEDAAAWRPVKGGRALLLHPYADDPVPVVVDRLYVSEGIEVAHVVTEDGASANVTASRLREPGA